MFVSKKKHEKILKEKKVLHHRQIANALLIIRNSMNNILVVLEKYERKEYGSRRALNEIRKIVQRALTITNNYFKIED
ncbi:MAG: hypothetical protein CBB96_00840 [Gammaproteobacteria bacterium TMED36]|nr:MAG: hypothetical protein CBB96_00840 [Gammaproteobacteria bacterium TMED36]